jgi:hypothetical protein
MSEDNDYETTPVVDGVAGYSFVVPVEFARHLERDGRRAYRVANELDEELRAALARVCELIEERDEAREVAFYWRGIALGEEPRERLPWEG